MARIYEYTRAFGHPWHIIELIDDKEPVVPMTTPTVVIVVVVVQLRNFEEEHEEEHQNYDQDHELEKMQEEKKK